MTLHDARTFNVPRTAGTWPAQRLVEARAVSPPAWFLPGPIRIRGGAARHFASGSGFCGGIHLKSTLGNPAIKTIYINGLQNYRFLMLDFLLNPQIQFAESTVSNPTRQIQANGKVNAADSPVPDRHFSSDRTGPALAPCL